MSTSPVGSRLSPSSLGPRSTRRRLVLASAALALACLLGGRPTRAASDDLVILVNAKNARSPDLAEVKQLYLGETMFWPGNVPAHLFVRPLDAPPTVSFFRMLRVAPNRFRRTWQEKQLSGQGSPPDSIGPVPALIAKVAADPGAMGFALADEVPATPAGVRVIPLH